MAFKTNKTRDKVVSIYSFISFYFRKLNKQFGGNGKHHKTQALLHVTMQYAYKCKVPLSAQWVPVEAMETIKNPNFMTSTTYYVTHKIRETDGNQDTQ